MDTEKLAGGLVTMRPFVPALDYEKSLGFYREIGFDICPLGDKLSICFFRQAAFSFLLQSFPVKEFAENFMMHVLVKNLDDWWEHLSGLDLKKFGGEARPPELQPWGLKVSYVVDPSSVLWHFAQD